MYIYMYNILYYYINVSRFERKVLEIISTK